MSREDDRLHEAEASFQLLVDSVTDYAIYMLDPDGRVTSWNPGAERLKGFTAAEILGRSMRIFYTPEDLAAGVPEAELRAARARGRIEREGWRVRKDGSRFFSHVTLTALRGADDTLVGFGEVCRDMTLQRAAEERLRQSEERYRLLVDSIEEYAAYVLDPNGYVTSWNPGAERIKGYRAEEILGRHVSCFYRPEDVAAGKPQRELETAAREGLYQEEGPRVRRGGREFWASVIVRPLRAPSGELLGFAKVTRDLTLRRRTDTTLRVLADTSAALVGPLDATEALTRVLGDLVGTLADGAFLQIETGGPVRATPAVAHARPSCVVPLQQLAAAVADDPLDGGQPEAEGGRPRTSGGEARALDVADGALPAAIVPTLEALGADGLLVAPIAIDGQRDGRLVLLRAAVKPPWAPDEGRLAVELTRRIGLYLANARLFEKTRAALEARDRFLLVAAHELRTPLAALQLQLDGLARLKVTDPVVAEQLTDRLGRARRQLERYDGLVDRLLSVAAPRDPVPGDQRVDLVGLVRGAIAQLERTHGSGHRVTVSAPPTLAGPWRADLVEEALTSILTNAVTYGGDADTEVHIERRGPEARIRVRDRGMGIAGVDLERIFERFERAVSERHYGGLGLGLYIARRNVEALGGHIEVVSVPDEGSVFTIVLPLGDTPEG